ncbi:MAG: T9SS type A sorting domain-containing protein [Bacteroidota bacterium]
MTKNLLLIFSLSLLPFFSQAQKQTQKWFFANKAGLDFVTSPPTVLTGAQIMTNEGSATVSDAEGNLLFYTEGVKIWNKNHTVMVNGTGLKGDLSTTQSALIIKKPGSTNIYFVFSLQAGLANDSLFYSIVDMNLDNGNGAVTVKNVFMSEYLSEKLAGTIHCNGIDYWVMTHNRGTEFRSFLVNNAGVNLTPVISNIPTPNFLSLLVGWMKFSPNGKKVGWARGNGQPGTSFELFDFDNSTGIVSGALQLAAFTTPSSPGGPYGCEFSPDGTKFYGARVFNNSNIVPPVIYQWNLCAGSNPAIVASQFTISSPGENYGMQLAMDGKIYMNCEAGYSMSVINNPNAPGAACNFVYGALSIAPGAIALGTPNFPSNYLKQLPTFTSTINCSQASFSSLSLVDPNAGCSAANNSITGVNWNFGDPASGNNNTSTLANPTHLYPGNGTYTASIVLSGICTSDTIKIPVTISGHPVLSVAGSFTVCKGDNNIYTASGANSYTWSNSPGTNTIAITPTTTSVYTVSGTSSLTGCSSVKSFTIVAANCVGLNTPGNEDNSMRIYPNPGNTEINIETNKDCRITILNQLGNPVLEQRIQIGKNLVDISQLSNGIYFIKSSDGTKERIGKLVKIN